MPPESPRLAIPLQNSFRGRCYSNVCKKLSQISTVSNRQKHLGARGPTYPRGRSWLSAALHIFLNMIDECFPKSHRLHKIFNRNTLKLSYSCMQNIISSYNKLMCLTQLQPKNAIAASKISAHSPKNDKQKG